MTGSLLSPAALRPLLSAGLLAMFCLAAFVPAALGQDADTTAGPPTPATAGQGEEVPGTAWLLPFQSLAGLEPITWTIVLCSVVAITLIIQAFLRVRRQVLLPEDSHARIEELIRGKQFQELVEYTETDDAFVSGSLNPALRRAPSFTDMREALEGGVAERQAEELRKLEYINILANVGPLLGLLGTVIGIMDAFLAMRRAGGTADVSALAGGISTALGTTMMGLLLAIPCVVCYGILRNKADRLTNEGGMLAEEFLLMLKPDKGTSSSSSGSSSSGSSRPSGSPRPSSSASSSRSSSKRPAAPAPTAGPSTAPASPDAGPAAT